MPIQQAPLDCLQPTYYIESGTRDHSLSYLFIPRQKSLVMP